MIGNREVIASVTTGHFCGQSPAQEDDYTIHVDLRFQQPFTASHVTGTSANGGPGTIVLDFPAGTSVTAKAGVSYTSDANAALNLATEIPGWNLGAVREAARSAWDAQLGKIEVGGGTKDQQVQFYTALYHALLHPNTFSDVNGQYTGFDGKVHTTDPGHVEYATFSGWDTYRSQAQLEAVVAPQQMSDTVRSMLHQYEQMGQLPKCGVQQRRELRHGRRPGRRDHRRRLRLRRPGLRRPGGAVRHGRRGHPEEQRPPGPAGP